MSFLTIMQSVAKNAGIAPVTTTGSANPDHVKLAQFINDAGAEIARRVDWSALRNTATLTGTGADVAHSIAVDFDRLPDGLCVKTSDGPVRGSLTADEWFSLTAIQGTPRYFYLKAATLSLYPYLASAATASVMYQSKNWVSGADTMTADGDAALIDEKLIETGAVVRWRRHIGKDYADHMAEFEAMLADRARFDGGVRAP